MRLEHALIGLALFNLAVLLLEGLFQVARTMLGF
jgi:hypothetical protein